MNSIKFFQRKNWLWLLVLPPLLSFALVSVVKPTGRFSFWIELAIYCLCSFSCGFVFAIQYFKTFKQCVWGGIILSVGSLFLSFTVISIGCSISPPREYAPSLPPTPLQLQQIEIQQRAQVAKQVVPRDAEADSSMIDLTPYYDGLPTCRIFYPHPQFIISTPKLGTRVWNGIKFDVRGVVATYWSTVKVNDILVDRKCSELDFLNGVNSYGISVIGNNTNVVCRYIIHFESGHTEIVPVIFGRDVADSFCSTQVPVWHGVVLTNFVVWQEKISTNSVSEPFYGFFIQKWNNPFPDEMIKTIDVIRNQANADAFLVAITLR